MTRPLDALAEVLHDHDCGCNEIGDWQRHIARARICLRAIGEGKVVPREMIAGLLSTIEVATSGQHPSECLPLADAILSMFREAGE